MYRIGNYLGASGEGGRVDSNAKEFTFLKKIFFSQVVMVFYEFSLVK